MNKIIIEYGSYTNIKGYFIQNLSFNNATSILYKLGYKNPLKTIIKKNRTKLLFTEGEAVYNEITGTLKIIKY